MDVGGYADKLRGWWGGDPLEALILTTADRDEALFSVPHCHAPFGQSFEDYNARLERWVRSFRRAGIGGVNFGYLLIWKEALTAGGAVTARVIHNPSTPIHDEVSAWLAQRRLWTAPDAGALFLSLHPDIRLGEERGRGGRDPRYTVTVADNAFYTTYVISEDVHRALLHIDAAQPRLGRRAEDEPWLEELHRVGALRLRRAQRLPEERRVGAPRRAATRVEALATKTTPTCLSSYLG